MIKLTKSEKLDRRYKSNQSIEAKEYYFWKKYGTYISVGILGFIAGTILTKALWDINHPKQLSRPLSQTIGVIDKT